MGTKAYTMAQGTRHVYTRIFGTDGALVGVFCEGSALEGLAISQVEAIVLSTTVHNDNYTIASNSRLTHSEHPSNCSVTQ